jgi:hypothetical protein
VINESPSRPPRGEEMIGCFQTLGSETRNINYHKRGDVSVLCTLGIKGNVAGYKDSAALPLKRCPRGA